VLVARDQTPAVNSVPVAFPQKLQLLENMSVTGQLAAMGAHGDVLTFEVATAPANGALQLDPATGTFTYRPTTAFFGADAFTFTVTDGQATSPPATVSLEVLFQPQTPVDAFGAVGDGVTDDTASLKAAIAAVGADGTLVFTPGKTYVLTAMLVPLTGQTWSGYGAVLRRRDETVTHTSTPITTDTNPTSFVVDSTAGLAVGMEITVTTGRNDADGCWRPHNIVAIDQDTHKVTVGGNFMKAFPGGGMVVTNHGLVFVTEEESDVKILGLELDGNRDHNDTYLNWQTQGSIRALGDRSIVRDCYVHDSTSDGVMIGGAGSIVSGNSIVTSGGNAIHLSGATGVQIANNYLRDATLSITGTDDTTGPDHAEGLITFSSLISDTTISYNQMENGRTCVGGVGSADNSDITIVGNTCRGAVLYALEIVTTDLGDGTDALRNVVVEGNRFYDSGNVYLGKSKPGGTPGTVGLANLTFTSNLLVNTPIYGIRLQGATLSNNDISVADAVAPIALSSPQDVVVSNNRVVGGTYGIRLDVADAAPPGVLSNTSNVTVSGNVLTQQTKAGLYAEVEDGKAFSNVAFQGNSIAVDSDAAADYTAIQGMNGLLVQSNSIAQSGGLYGITCAGDLLASPSGVPGTYVVENVITTNPSVPSVKVYGGHFGNVIHDNSVVAPMSIGSAGNTVLNNYTIP
jgi:hypothetical protein